ncbi:MAG TPA: dienelactone hydrolase family protein [Hyphomonadaceae bacterium]|jgi:dienelactone hydrolase|nr:dienelactone hydrolase family protein [Hyphomonadaceae bacterium]
MHKLFVRLAAAIAVAMAALMAAGTASARETVQQRIDALLPGADLLMPEGKGPFPVAIQLHGCGGKGDFQLGWAEVARKAGWAVIVVDSYKHRNISRLQAYATVCTGMHLWGRDRAGDLYAMMEWVRHQGWADPNRIVAAGWSHGGWTTLDAMSLTPGADMANSTRLVGLSDDPMKGLVGAFVVYPYCGIGCVAAERGTRVDVPVRALVGTADVIVGNTGLAKTLRKMKTPKSAIDVTMLEGATHAFDEPKARDMRVKYDPALTERAHGLYTDFLKSLVVGVSPAATATAVAAR